MGDTAQKCGIPQLVFYRLSRKAPCKSIAYQSWIICPFSDKEPPQRYAPARGPLWEVWLQVHPNIYWTGCRVRRKDRLLHSNPFFLRLTALPAKSDCTCSSRFPHSIRESRRLFSTVPALQQISNTSNPYFHRISAKIPASCSNPTQVAMPIFLANSVISSARVILQKFSYSTSAAAIIIHLFSSLSYSLIASCFNSRSVFVVRQKPG